MAIARGRGAFRETMVQKASLEIVAGEGVRPAKLLRGEIALAAPKLELAEGREVEWVTGEAPSVRDGPKLRQAALGSVALRNRQRALERDHRRAPE